MLLELILLAMNIVLALLIVYTIVQPHRVKREVRELIERARQGWKKHRPLRAKTPKACGMCCATKDEKPAERARPVPYRDGKSKRGRRKMLDSAGYTCLQPGCAYFLETDATVHALIGDGKRGAAHDIQQWRCQACGHGFTMWRGTALYRLKTPAQVVGIGLHLLCRGMSGREVAEVLGVDEATVALWLERSGEHAHRLHQHYATDQRPAVLQLDELLATRL